MTKELTYRSKRLLEQAEILRKLGEVLEKNAKTEEQHIRAKVSIGIAEVAEKLAEWIEENKFKKKEA